MGMAKPVLIDIPLHQDDRGSVYCALDHLHTKGVKRIYMVENFTRGRIRAWHGHRKAGTYMHVIRGACKIAAMNMDKHIDVTSAVLTECKPQIFYVPPGYYNGAMSLTDGTKILIFSTLTFDEVKNDDERQHYSIMGETWKVENR